MNDIAKRDEVIYISDSGDLLNDKGGGRIFRVDSDKKVTVLVDKSNSKLIRSPNGLSTHQDGYLMFNDFENGFLFKVNLTDNKVEKIGEGYGAADGLVMADNNLYLSDWKNGKVFKLDLSKEGSIVSTNISFNFSKVKSFLIKIFFEKNFLYWQKPIQLVLILLR